MTDWFSETERKRIEWTALQQLLDEQFRLRREIQDDDEAAEEQAA